MMIRNATIVLGAVLLLAGCAEVPSNGPPAKPGMTSGITGITAEGAARVAATDGFEAKRKIVLETCAAAGLAVRSRGFARCVTTYFAIDAARARAHAKALSDQAARRHGLCVDPIRFELARCIEI
jgi:hypothetical protein